MQSSALHEPDVQSIDIEREHLRAAILTETFERRKQTEKIANWMELQNMTQLERRHARKIAAMEVTSHSPLSLALLSY